MRRTASAALLLMALSMGMPRVSAQDNPKGEDVAMLARQTETTPLKVWVTFTEFEGDKKVKSLPYTLVVTAGGKSVVKMGSRVPVYTGKEHGMQYLDVGSNIDCQAART